MQTELDFGDDSRRAVIYESLRGRFDHLTVPDWYGEAVRWLRGGADDGLFGLYLYNLLLELNDIATVVNIGTARGHSTVCLAKGLVDGRGAGSVHTIDVLDPREPRDWHVSKQSSDDPAIGHEFPMVDLVGRFHDPDDGSVPVEFHRGESSIVLSDLNLDGPDIVFHDGLHTYSTVTADIEATSDAGALPIHVFDDCYLFSSREVGLLNSDLAHRLDSIPLVRNYVRRLRSVSLTRTEYPGVTRAVREAYESGLWSTLEVVRDEDHAPITTLVP